jgi:ribulose kinase
VIARSRGIAADPARALVVGVDFGTLPGRALVVRVADGAKADVYTPVQEDVATYDELCAEYRTLHDYCGRGEKKVMNHRDLLRRAHSSQDGVRL